MTAPPAVSVAAHAPKPSTWFSGITQSSSVALDSATLSTAQRSEEITLSRVIITPLGCAVDPEVNTICASASSRSSGRARSSAAGVTTPSSTRPRAA
ncbi:MAG: hypothetical protein QM820_24315 [Minicystis sp.]